MTDPTPTAEPHASDTTEDAVTLSIPGDARYLRVGRLVAAALGAALDFDVDQLEDVRIGLDELCTAVLEAGADRLDLHFRLGDDGLHIAGSGRSAAGAQVAWLIDELRATILGAVSDGFTLDVADDMVTFTSFKQGRSQATG